MPIELVGTGPNPVKYEYSTLTTGKSAWLKQVQKQRESSPYYRKELDTLNCIMVRDYLDLTDGVGEIENLLCQSSFSPTFVDLGDAHKGHNLVINVEGGKVYVNGYLFIGGVSVITSLGDGSWGIVQQDTPTPKQKGLLGFLLRVYDSWLKEVCEKLNLLGLIDNNPLYERSIWHLITDDLPKGKIIAKTRQN